MESPSISVRVCRYLPYIHERAPVVSLHHRHVAVWFSGGVTAHLLGCGSAVAVVKLSECLQSGQSFVSETKPRTRAAILDPNNCIG